MDVDQQQLTLPSTELLSIPHVPPTSPSPYFTVDEAQSSPLAHTPIVIVDDDDNNEVPVSPDLQTPETPLTPLPPEEAVNEYVSK